MLNQENAKKYNDSVAAQTSWAPLLKGGAGFKTYNLVSVSPGRLEFRPSTFALIFYSLFILLGGGLVMGSFYNVYAESFTMEPLSLLQVSVGLLFLFAGISILVKNGIAIVFDKTIGYYWRGFRKPDYSTAYKKTNVFFKIIDIHALQLITEHVKGNKRSYYSYELNIVLRDGIRKNIVDHGDLEKLAKEARQLAQFINRPLWSDSSPADD